MNTRLNHPGDQFLPPPLFEFPPSQLLLWYLIAKGPFYWIWHSTKYRTLRTELNATQSTSFPGEGSWVQEKLSTWGVSQLRTTNEGILDFIKQNITENM